jgi:putative tricarboxylic transport membrane protein
MSGDGNAANEGPSHRGVELGLGLLMGVFGAIVVYGAMKAGIAWGFDGPGAGFFPFYIGLLILGATAVNLWQVWNDRSMVQAFSDWDQLKQVMSVALPTLVYVVLIAFIGIYVSSTLLIAYFMMWLSGYGWLRTALVSVLVPLITFLVFERWFLVTLPKGPLERLLGY